MSIFDEVTQRISSQVSSAVDKAVSGFSLASAGRAAAMEAVGRFAPKEYSAVNKALSGDYLGAGIDALKQTALGSKLNGLLSGSLISDLLFQSNRNPLLGGITPAEAKRICAEVQATQYAKKNLFFLEIVDYFPDLGGTQGQTSSLFNMFATSVSVGPNTISGDNHAVGSANIDNVHGSERIELRVTTYDDAAGSIKQWFQTRADLIAHSDGTFGVPADYLVQVRILHAAINDDVMARYGGYEEKFIMRCGSLETELNRSEDGLQEVQLSFVQFDTFMFDQT